MAKGRSEGCRASDAVLMQFTSHLCGRRADVRLLTTRIEWSHPGCDDVTQMLPVTAISSVETRRAGLTRRLVTVTSHAAAIEFRVDRSTATELGTLLDHLVEEQRLVPPVKTVKQVGPQRPLKGSIADEMMNLKWLLDVGVLTQPEFAEQRNRLLDF
jgi:hypothetical protein